MQLKCNGQTDRPMDGPMDGLMDQQSGVETKELHSILEYPKKWFWSVNGLDTHLSSTLSSTLYAAKTV